MELACQVTLANDLGIAPDEDSDNLRNHIAKLSNKINSLRKSQLSRINK